MTYKAGVDLDLRVHVLIYSEVSSQYTLVAELMAVSPDGYLVENKLVMNRSIPGPTIEADWGDQIIIHVVNNIPDNGTAIHWHGSEQQATSNCRHP